MRQYFSSLSSSFLKNVKIVASYLGIAVWCLISFQGCEKEWEVARLRDWRGVIIVSESECEKGRRKKKKKKKSFHSIITTPYWLPYLFTFLSSPVPIGKPRFTVNITYPYYSPFASLHVAFDAGCWAAIPLGLASCCHAMHDVVSRTSNGGEPKFQQLHLGSIHLRFIQKREPDKGLVLRNKARFLAERWRQSWDSPFSPYPASGPI